MRKFIVCMFLTFSVSKCLWATSIAWDYDFTQSNATGFKVYEQSVFGPRTMDAGNFLTFQPPGLKPGVSYTYYVTAYNSVQESEPSNTITFSEPIPPTHLEVVSSGTLLAHVFPGNFELESSEDLKTWNAIQQFTATSSTQKLSAISTNPHLFFRLKYLVESPMQTAVVMLRQSIRAQLPPMPPLPAPTQPKVKFSNRVKYWWHDKMFKLSYALKYKPGHHPDMKKGAEVMTGRKP